MVVDISLNIRKGFIFESFFQFFNALLILLVRVVSQTKFVENLSVVGVLLESTVQVSRTLIIILQVVVGGGAVFQELDIWFFLIFLHVFVQSCIIIFKCFIIHFLCMIALSKTVQNSRNTVIELQCFIKIIDGRLNLPRLQFRSSIMEVSFNTFWININSMLEIFNRHVVVGHILVNKTTFNINSLVVR
jgi:hypothetical protein